MALTFANAEYGTSSNSFIWANLPTCSTAFWFRPELTGAVVNQLVYVLSRTKHTVIVAFTPKTLTSTGGTGSLSVTFYNATGQNTTLSATLNIGSSYHIALTYDQGVQALYVNGAPSRSASPLTGNTQTYASVPWCVNIGMRWRSMPSDS